MVHRKLQKAELAQFPEILLSIVHNISTTPILYALDMVQVQFQRIKAKWNPRWDKNKQYVQTMR